MSEEMKKRLGIVDGLSAWRNDHRLAIMIAGAITASLVLVGVSLWLYDSSGAAQLDLSRPGYSSVRDQARPDDRIDTFPSTGAITEETLAEFEGMFSRYADEATAVDAFGGDVLSDEQLGLSVLTTEPEGSEP